MRLAQVKFTKTWRLTVAIFIFALLHWMHNFCHDHTTELGTKNLLKVPLWSSEGDSNLVPPQYRLIALTTTLRSSTYTTQCLNVFEILHRDGYVGSLRFSRDEAVIQAVAWNVIWFQLSSEPKLLEANLIQLWKQLRFFLKIELRYHYYGTKNTLKKRKFHLKRVRVFWKLFLTEQIRLEGAWLVFGGYIRKKYEN